MVFIPISFLISVQYLLSVMHGIFFFFMFLFSFNLARMVPLQFLLVFHDIAFLRGQVFFCLFVHCYCCHFLWNVSHSEFSSPFLKIHAKLRLQPNT